MAPRRLPAATNVGFQLVSEVWEEDGSHQHMPILVEKYVIARSFNQTDQSYNHEKMELISIHVYKRMPILKCVVLKFSC